jgi:hypothetical protein
LRFFYWIERKLDYSRVQILVMKLEVMMKEVFLVVLVNKKQNEYLNQQQKKKLNKPNR